MKPKYSNKGILSQVGSLLKPEKKFKDSSIINWEELNKALEPLFEKNAMSKSKMFYYVKGGDFDKWLKKMKRKGKGSWNKPKEKDGRPKLQTHKQISQLDEQAGLVACNQQRNRHVH